MWEKIVSFVPLFGSTKHGKQASRKNWELLNAERMVYAAN
jgi:hypothetical protein